MRRSLYPSKANALVNLQSRRSSIILYLAVSLLVVILLTFRNTLLKLPEGPLVNIGWQHGQAAVLKQPAVLGNATVYEESDTDISILDPDSLPPLTEIYIQSCTFPPDIWNICAPPSTPAEEAVRGPWTMLNRDLNKRVG